MKNYYVTLIIGLIWLFLFNSSFFGLSLIILSVFLFEFKKPKDSLQDDSANIDKKQTTNQIK